MPVCLPEQLLKARVAGWPERISASADGAWVGKCGPQASAPSSSPILASQSIAAETCMGSPPWLAADSAKRGSGTAKASAAPLSIRPSDWIGLMAERGNTGLAMSPCARRMVPSACATATITLWRDSTAWPRTTSICKGAFMTARTLPRVRVRGKVALA
jgi:hypothetical protein